MKVKTGLRKKDYALVLGIPLLFVMLLIFLKNRTPTYQTEIIVVASNPLTQKIQGGSLRDLDHSVRRLIKLKNRMDISSSLQQRRALVATLDSRDFISNFIQNNNLKPLIFHKRWDNEKQQWRSKRKGIIKSIFESFRNTKKKVRQKKEPSDYLSTLLLSKKIRVKKDKQTGFISIKVKWHDPHIGAKLLNDLVVSANHYIAEREAQGIQKEIQNLEALLNTIKIPKIRKRVFEEIASRQLSLESKHESIAPSFKVIDPAYPPEKPSFRLPKILILVTYIFGAFITLCVILHRKAKADIKPIKTNRLTSDKVSPQLLHHASN